MFAREQNLELEFQCEVILSILSGDIIINITAHRYTGEHQQQFGPRPLPEDL
jgi:hypothetical protein